MNRDVVVTLIKIFSVILLALLLFAIGLMIGYSGFGDGSATHVFNRALWHHIFDFFDF